MAHDGKEGGNEFRTSAKILVHLLRHYDTMSELQSGPYFLLIGAHQLYTSVIRAVAEKLKGKEDAGCLRLLAKDIFGPPKHTRSRERMSHFLTCNATVLCAPPCNDNVKFILHGPRIAFDGIDFFRSTFEHPLCLCFFGPQGKLVGATPPRKKKLRAVADMHHGWAALCSHPPCVVYLNRSSAFQILGDFSLRFLKASKSFGFSVA